GRAHLELTRRSSGKSVLLPSSPPSASFFLSEWKRQGRAGTQLNPGSLGYLAYRALG
ncbi:hypothetical protein M9458_053615, partial [Cirrhinus mrigala]